MSVHLRRSLSLTLLTLYGTGTMVGAGIYVLLGQTAGLAGMQTPLAYLLAAIVVIPTALSFGELASRYPQSAGEAAYVRAGLNSDRLSLIVGLMVVAAGSVSAASITIGCVGYIQTFFNQLPDYVGILLVIGILGLLAVWGITQSVVIAALLAIVEIGGLIVIIIAGLPETFSSTDNFSAYFIPDSTLAWSGVLSASMLAFYAFIGFEDMVNIAEEVKRPRRNLPLGILLALTLTTLLYLLISIVAVSVVPAEKLSASTAPLGLIFSHTTNMPVEIMNAIGIMAALNGILIQIIMAPRILYGLSSQRALPAVFSKIHPVTRTPLVATLLVIIIVLTLALAFPIDKLARWTSLITLTVFTLCNFALIRIKRTKPPPAEVFTVAMPIPVTGFIISLVFLAQEFVRQLIGN